MRCVPNRTSVQNTIFSTQVCQVHLHWRVCENALQAHRVAMWPVKITKNREECSRLENTNTLWVMKKKTRLEGCSVLWSFPAFMWARERERQTRWHACLKVIFEIKKHDCLMNWVWSSPCCHPSCFLVRGHRSLVWDKLIPGGWKIRLAVSVTWCLRKTVSFLHFFCVRR